MLKNGKLLIRLREKILNNFKSKNSDKIQTPKAAPEPKLEEKVFPTLKLTKRQTKKSLTKPYENFCNKIGNNETNTNTEIFNTFFKYQLK